MKLMQSSRYKVLLAILAVSIAIGVLVGQLATPTQHRQWRGQYDRVTRVVADVVCVADCRYAAQSSTMTIVPVAIEWQAGNGMAPGVGLALGITLFAIGLSLLGSKLHTYVLGTARRQAWLCAWKS